MNRIVAAAGSLLLVSGCQKQPEQVAPSNEQNTPAPAAPTPAASPANQAAPPSLPEPGTSGRLPGNRTPLPEPKGPIDPRSTGAAGQVVQHYGALIEQKRWRESWKLWSSADAARQFDQNWTNDSDVHMEIGKPGDMEGAAGSSFVTVPALFYGKTKSGKTFRRGAGVILRRVNDVPGSSEAQRRWRIERIDWKDAA